MCVFHRFLSSNVKVRVITGVLSRFCENFNARYAVFMLELAIELYTPSLLDFGAVFFVEDFIFCRTVQYLILHIFQSQFFWYNYSY